MLCSTEYIYTGLDRMTFFGNFCRCVQEKPLEIWKTWELS